VSDFAQYVDLSLYDVTVDELVNRALLDAATKLPDWTPREGHTEVVLTEALSLVVAELVYAINRIPPLTLEALLGLYGVVRDVGEQATGVVEVTASDTFGHTIPEGTALRASNGETGEEVEFTTTDVLVISPGDATGTVAIIAAETGVAGNGFTVGTLLELIDAVAFIDQVEITTATSGGTELESDSDFYDRGALLLSRLTTTLVLADHFTAAALEHTAVGRANTYDLYDGVGASVGADVGHVTVVVTDDNGAVLDAGTKTEIETDLEAKAVAGLNVHVIDPTYTTVDIDVDIKVLPGFDAAEVTAAVEEALAGYLSPATWEWGTTVYVYELVSLIDQVEGVDRPATFTDPVADVTLSGDAGQLAEAGTIVVNVV
jgi:uncharacterized phage protein gp47/JayE